MPLKIWTIGHSTRPVEEFIGMLEAAGVGLLVDVRAFPGSRRHPQFNRDALASSLDRRGITYRWEGKALGGFRKPRADSPNTALRNASFRAYADHMISTEFAAAAGGLVEDARGTQLALMCAEQHPSHCHRRLISDWLAARGVEVDHLLGPGRTERHVLSEGAVIVSGEVAYRGGQRELELRKVRRSGSRGSR
jgi:uncharacterized protein (DUF488 family)